MDLEEIINKKCASGEVRISSINFDIRKIYRLPKKLPSNLQAIGFIVQNINHIPINYQSDLDLFVCQNNITRISTKNKWVHYEINQVTFIPPHTLIHNNLFQPLDYLDGWYGESRIRCGYRIKKIIRLAKLKSYESFKPWHLSFLN